MSIMDDLLSVGLNTFAVQLLAESLLRSPMAPISAGEPLTFFFPVHREDCAGWVGVKITLEAVRAQVETEPQTTYGPDDAEFGMSEHRHKGNEELQP